MNHELFSTVDKYISHLLAPEDEALRATEQSIIDNNIPQISISPNQGKFLQVLAKISQAKNILEMGTLAGYSTIWLGRALPSDGKLTSLEYDPFHAKVAQENIERAGLGEKVTIHVGMALDLLPQLEEENCGPFDFIFIDADKPPYLEYFEWAVKLSKPGTVIIADNVIREGMVLDLTTTDERVIGVRRLNAALAHDTRVTATIIQTVGVKEHDGMVIAIVN